MCMYGCFPCVCDFVRVRLARAHTCMCVSVRLCMFVCVCVFLHHHTYMGRSMRFNGIAGSHSHLSLFGGGMSCDRSQAEMNAVNRL